MVSDVKLLTLEVKLLTLEVKLLTLEVTLLKMPWLDLMSSFNYFLYSFENEVSQIQLSNCIYPKFYL